MNMPPQLDPGNDPSSGFVGPRMRPTAIATVVPTADLNRFVRSTTAVDTPHTVSPFCSHRAETDGVQQDRVDSALRFPTSS
jgi:hypothetical protein